MGWLSRLELPTSGATIRRSNQLNYNHHMEQVMGIEPTSQPWQGRIITVILHLHGISIATAVPSGNSLFISSANGTNYGEWCGVTGSNRRPYACKAYALPAELTPQI